MNYYIKRELRELAMWLLTGHFLFMNMMTTHTAYMRRPTAPSLSARLHYI